MFIHAPWQVIHPDGSRLWPSEGEHNDVGSHMWPSEGEHIRFPQADDSLPGDARYLSSGETNDDDDDEGCGTNDEDEGCGTNDDDDDDDDDEGWEQVRQSEGSGNCPGLTSTS